jgi:hypothetical protein
VSDVAHTCYRKPEALKNQTTEGQFLTIALSLFQSLMYIHVVIPFNLNSSLVYMILFLFKFFLIKFAALVAIVFKLLNDETCANLCLQGSCKIIYKYLI